MVVFLIGESPVTGISKPQFTSALLQYKELKPYSIPSDLNIVGPVFSGTVDSIAKVLYDKKVLDNYRFHAISGTASLPDLEHKLRELVSYKKDKISLKQLDSEPEAFQTMIGALGNEERTALIREADTSYGEELVQNDKFQQFKYSRSLLHLRAAYEADTDLMARIFPKALRPNQLALRFATGKEQIDTLPVYAPENFAVSQQLTLRHLASYLSRAKFLNLIITGSDPLDMVFLARFFQEEAPNLRLAVLTSDDLLDREAGSVSLRGVLTISKQPTGAVAHKQIELPSATSFGIYEASRLQLNPGHLVAKQAVLSVVGVDGEWPILTKGDVNEKKSKSWRKFIRFGPLVAGVLVIIFWHLDQCLPIWC